MPELPEATVYIDALERRIVGETLLGIRLASPFVLRTVQPRPAELAGRRVTGLRRVGKRIVMELEGGDFVVVHLMMAGRLRWLEAGAKVPGKIGLAAFDFSTGTLVLTEAGSKRRASIHLVRGEAALAALDPGGIDVMAATEDEFRQALLRERHTLKRSLTDPRLFSGIGNAYSDEILHRARLSPVQLTTNLGGEEIARLHAAVRETLDEWTGAPARARPATASPRRSRRSTRRWRCTGGSASRAPSAARRCSASATPRTRPTTAPAARPAAACWPTARSAACSRTTGRAASTTWPDALRRTRPAVASAPRSTIRPAETTAPVRRDQANANATAIADAIQAIRIG